MKSKVIIVDDHPIFRMGMAELLNQEEDFMVCGLAEDISSASKVIEETIPSWQLSILRWPGITVLNW